MNGCFDTCNYISFETIEGPMSQYTAVLAHVRTIHNNAYMYVPCDFIFVTLHTLSYK